MFGGGGSGAGWVGGGGGGGGYVEESIPIETGVTYTVAIGAVIHQDQDHRSGNGLGNDGGNTTFATPGGTFTAYGGGGGGGNGQATASVGPGRPGGSGGGMGAGSYSPATVGLGNKVTDPTQHKQHHHNHKYYQEFKDIMVVLKAEILAAVAAALVL